MQITSQSTAYYQQPSQLPANGAQKPQELSPEEQRAQTVKREDSVQALQDNRQDNKDQTRSATVAVVGNQQQQQNIDRYIEASTGSEVDSGPSLTSQINTLQDIAQSVRVNELATAAGQNPEAVEAIRNRPSAYEPAPAPPNNLPRINEFA